MRLFATHDDTTLPLRMAAALGISLDRLLHCRALYDADIARVIRRCRRCTGARECRLWLETHAKAQTAPAYCRNRAFFAELKS